MASKPRKFSAEYYYHIYNCGVEKRKIFNNDQDYIRLLDTIDFYRYEQKASYVQFQNLNKEAKQVYTELHPRDSNHLNIRLVAYCLMPNHFHFLIKPAKKGSIPQFMSNISNSYTRYFNIKNERLGSLFQGTYKAKEIPNDESLLQISRYIHLNPCKSRKANLDGNLRPENYPFSSYRNWIRTGLLNLKGLIFDKDEAWKCIGLANGTEAYKSFVEAKIDQNETLGIGDLIFD
ncbi:MAG: transposase [Patescibacteria group bacterium]